MRELSPEQTQQIYDAYGEVPESQSEYTPLLSHVEERIADEFDVRGDDHPPNLNRVGRTHHMALYREWRRYRESVAWQAKALRLPTPLVCAVVRATLVYRRKPFRDIDSAAASLKPVLDGLVAGGVLVDDGSEYLRLEVTQELGAERAVRVEVWPAARGPGAA